MHCSVAELRALLWFHLLRRCCSRYRSLGLLSDKYPERSWRRSGAAGHPRLRIVSSPASGWRFGRVSRWAAPESRSALARMSAACCIVCRFSKATRLPGPSRCSETRWWLSLLPPLRCVHTSVGPWDLFRSASSYTLLDTCSRSRLATKLKHQSNRQACYRKDQLRKEEAQEKPAAAGGESYKVLLQTDEIETVLLLTPAAPSAPLLSFLCPTFTPTTTAITATITSNIHALIAMHPFLDLLSPEGDDWAITWTRCCCCCCCCCWSTPFTPARSILE